MIISTKSPLGGLFAMTIGGIYALVAPWISAQPARAPFWMLILNRLNRMVLRLDRLALRFAAGTLPAPHPSRASQPRKPPAAPVGQQTLPRLSRANAWLVRLVQRTIQFSGQVETLINSPEGAALIAAAPQAGRIFRPLCRMLGIPQPASIRLPPRPRRTRPAPKPKQTAHRPTRAPKFQHPLYPVGFRPLKIKNSPP